MTGWLFTAGAILVAAAGYGRWRQIRQIKDTRLSDDAVRRIEAGERIEVDEPLDLEEAREEEERFWGETWDEPDPL